MTGNIIIAGVLYPVSVALGVWLSRRGRPLSPWLSVLHKLVSLAAAVFIALAVYASQGLFWKGTVPAVLSVFALSLTIELIVSGAILSGKKPNKALKTVHAISTVLVAMLMGGAVIL